MEFNKEQMRNLEEYLKFLDHRRVDPNFEPTPESKSHIFKALNDPATRAFIDSEEFRENESLYQTIALKKINRPVQVVNNQRPVNEMGYANIVLMSIIVIVLVAILFVVILI